MTRIARFVAPGLPHHVVQRGNRRQHVFFSDDQRRRYLELLEGFSRHHGLAVWAYCLMDNHVHAIVVPSTGAALTRAIGETHRVYTMEVNQAHGWKGHLWQGRYASFVLQERHLFAAIRYVERNPVKAGMVRNAEDYPWSSAGYHVRKENSRLLSASPLEEQIADWRAYLTQEDEEAGWTDQMRLHERSGRPLGDEDFVVDLEARSGRRLRPLPPGPPPTRDRDT